MGTPRVSESLTLGTLAGGVEWLGEVFWMTDLE